MANSEKALEFVLKSEKSAAKLLSVAERKSLADADVLIYFRPDRGIIDFKLDFLTRLPDDLLEVLKTIRLGVGAFRINDGLGVSLTAVFPDKPPEATRKFLASLAGTKAGSDLKGLPDRPAIFAEGSKGEGRQNARLMKALADILLRGALEDVEWLPSPTDRANVLAAFSEILKRLQGHRLAVYQNADRAKHGLLSAVAILDTADADKFLSDVKQLCSSPARRASISPTRGTRTMSRRWKS